MHVYIALYTSTPIVGLATYIMYTHSDYKKSISIHVLKHYVLFKSVSPLVNIILMTLCVV